MSSNIKTARVVGVLFLTAFVTSMIGSQVFIEPVINVPNYLSDVYSNKSQLISGILLQLVCALAVVGIAVVLYPILKKHSKNIALGYLGFRIIESAIIFVSAISLLLLITASKQSIEMGTPEALPFQAMHALAAAGHYWAFQMVIIVCGVAGVMFCYLLYRSELIPKWISIIGIIGYLLSLLAPVLDMYGLVNTLRGAGVILYIPGSIFEILLLPLWLMIKGFNASAFDSEPVSGDKESI